MEGRIRAAFSFAIYIFLISIALFTLSIILMATRYNVKPDSTCTLEGEEDNVTIALYCDLNATISTTCNVDANTCLAGRYVADLGTCIQDVAFENTTCSSPCFVDGAVSAQCRQGECVITDPTECLGWCETNADCNTSMPINEWWITAVVNPSNNPTRFMYSYQYSCFLNSCRLFVLGQYAYPGREDISGQDSVIVPVDARIPCKQWLNVDWLRNRTDCVTEEHQLINMNLTKSISTMNSTIQYDLCALEMDCAPVNDSAAGGKRRTLLQSSLSQQGSEDGEYRSSAGDEEDLLIPLTDNARKRNKSMPGHQERLLEIFDELLLKSLHAAYDSSSSSLSQDKAETREI